MTSVNNCYSSIIRKLVRLYDEIIVCNKQSLCIQHVPARNTYGMYNNNNYCRHNYVKIVFKITYPMTFELVRNK